MDLTKFLSDFLIVAITTSIVLAPRALEAYLALHEEENAEQAGE